MSDDVLSQDEIDGLLSAIASGEIDATDFSSEHETNTIRIFDFRRPDKFTAEYIRNLAKIHELWSTHTVGALHRRLRVPANMHVSSIDQMTFEEFKLSTAEPALLAALDLGSLPPGAVLIVDSSICFSMVDCLLGGPGDPVDISRALSSTEIALLRAVLPDFLDGLAAGWADTRPIRPAISSLVLNPDYLHGVPPDEMVVLIEMETRIGEVEGVVQLCLPYQTLKPILSRLLHSHWYEKHKVESGPDPDRRRELESTVRVRIHGEIEIGYGPIDRSILSGLKSGQELPVSSDGTPEVLYEIIRADQPDE